MNPTWNFCWEIVLSNALVATLLAITVIAIGRVWKRPAVIHLLWVFVALKLFTPPLITFPASTLTGALAPASVTTAGTPHSDFSLIANSDLPANALNAEAQPPALANSNAEETTQTASGIALDQAAHVQTTPAQLLSWCLPHLAAIWAIGLAVVVVFRTIELWKFNAATRDLPPVDESTSKMVSDLAGQLGIKRVPEAFLTESALPPLVWAMGTRPRIILPRRLFENLSASSQASIVAHELIHIKRRDHWVRLLELVTTTVFWWHPVAWHAGRELRRLEEQCCDGRVIELLPGHERSYATALVDTIEFLAARHVPRLPLVTGVESVGSISRRIKMLENPKIGRLNFASAIAAMALVAFPLLTAFAGDPSDQSQLNTPNENMATIRGVVTDSSGEPLSSALVSVFVPAVEMRYPVADPHRLLHAKTDANGQYELRIPDISEPTEISIDAASPGYRRSSGTLGRGGDNLTATVEADKTATADVNLKRANYFSGVVVDEQGQPLAGIQVSANAATARSSCGIERTVSDKDGRFEIFNYPVEQMRISTKSLSSSLLELAGLNDANMQLTRGIVSFTHPKYIDYQIADVYQIAEADKETMRIVMATGHQVTGTVTDKRGNPVKGALVKCVVPSASIRKAVRTDVLGKFSLKGLPRGKGTLTCVDYEGDQKYRETFMLDANRTDLRLSLEPIELPDDLVAHDVFGVQLVDNSPQMASAYWHTSTKGAFIVSPGNQFLDGMIKKGDYIWMVGNKKIEDTSDMIDQLIAEADKQTGDVRRVRVVFSFDRPHMQGTNTQYLPVSVEALESLRGLQQR